MKSNTGRQRVNINGVLDPKTREVIIREDSRFNAEATIKFFQQIEKANPESAKIYLILDNAGYYKGKKIKEYLEDSKIEIIFLPPYSPNLNLIERLWKFFKKKVLYNRYYERYEDFRKACLSFFSKRNWRNMPVSLNLCLRRIIKLSAPKALAVILGRGIWFVWFCLWQNYILRLVS